MYDGYTVLLIILGLFRLLPLSHVHGFDVLFTGVRNVSGMKKVDSSVGYYSDENMWSWLPILKAHLKSGQYDYVFYLGADVLIQEIHLGFPVWMYDRGHGLCGCTIKMRDYPGLFPRCFWWLV